MSKLLWLDDVRWPPTDEWIWVKTAQEAIDFWNKNKIIFASLDHDLGPEHYPWNKDARSEASIRNSGEGVTNWLEEQILAHDRHELKPLHGIRVHSMNMYGAEQMLIPIEKIFGRNFQMVDRPEIGVEVLPWKLVGQPHGWWQRMVTPHMKAVYEGARHSQ
jgi:hypothetical protein